MDTPGKTYICHNGDFIHADRPFLGLPNRAFHHCDVIKEEVHAYASEPQFLEKHVHKLVSSMHLLSMEIPAYFKPADLNFLFSKLLRKNKCFGGAVVRLTVYRNSSRQDSAERNDVSFVLDSRRLEHDLYELNAKGSVIGAYHELTRYAHPLSSIRNADPMLFLKAEQYCQKNMLDECVFLNGNGRIVETVHSNIFLVKDQSVFTPSIEEGCIPGVMRSVMIDLCNLSGYRMNDRCRLSPEAMNEADEIFLTDAVNGLRWVGAYRQKRYYKKTVQQLHVALNRLAFGK